MSIAFETNQSSLPSNVQLDMIEQAVGRARDHLLQIQHADGYWVGELESDVSVTAGYIPLTHALGIPQPQRWQRAVSYIKSKQRPDGSWSSYPGGPGDVSVTVQAYFALKLAGIKAEEPFMRLAREHILSQGGTARTSTFTKVWLAVFGQFPWRRLPPLPPEVMLLPDWFYVNIYEFASWSRATIVALTIVLSLKPTFTVPDFASLEELDPVPEGQKAMGNRSRGFSGWSAFFNALDLLFRAWDRSPVKPGRALALRRAEKWVLEHQEADGSWGGIMLPWVYSLIALKALGYPDHHPAMDRGIKGLESFILQDEGSLRLQPAVSPVWDTAWAVLALKEAGLPSYHPAMSRAGRWLWQKQVLEKGDWKVKNPHTAPGAWAFEFENRFYPDIDDTALVSRALRRVDLKGEGDKEKALEKALNWMVDMQNRDGGWAAFDRNNNKRILAHIPFADFMTPLDPASPDVSAHVVELLGEMGYARNYPPQGKALSYLLRQQRPEGAWSGRWGVNYIYGTSLVLMSLKAAGEDMGQEHVQRAAAWLEAVQNGDGGWGETCRSYDSPAYGGKGPSTPSQTAWALLGLMGANRASSAVARQGIEYLVSHQLPGGGWEEEAFTGTGFPRAFYLRYHLYRIYFPLLAIARFRSLAFGEARNEQQ